MTAADQTRRLPSECGASIPSATVVKTVSIKLDSNTYDGLQRAVGEKNIPSLMQTLAGLVASSGMTMIPNSQVHWGPGGLYDDEPIPEWQKELLDERVEHTDAHMEELLDLDEVLDHILGE